MFRTRSSEQTRAFYGELVDGRQRRGMWGMENRFDPDGVASKPSVLRHFVPVVQEHLVPTDRCLDLGCGPGGFLAVMAPFCGHIVGADIVAEFVDRTNETIDRNGITNAEAVQVTGDGLPFDDASFDKVVLVDTIHHLEDVPGTIDEVARVLKPGGHVLVFEPNKGNLPLAVMCVLDRNERGLIPLGTFGAYRRVLGPRFSIEHEAYNGVLIGPEGKLSVAVADYVSRPDRPLVNWFSPKLFISARRC
jgi:SAM-dependent methyltransferase